MDWNRMRRLFATVNGPNHKTAPVVSTIRNDRKGNLVADKTMVAVRLKEHFYDLFNDNSYPKIDLT